MTWNDPNPLANPYTARQHRQMNVFRRDPNASLPHKESSIYVDELTVPDTETYVQNGLFGQTFRNGVLDLRSYSKSWNDVDQSQLYQQDQSLSRDDLKFKKENEEGYRHLLSTMTDDTKELLSHIEDFMGKSKFIDE